MYIAVCHCPSLHCVLIIDQAKDLTEMGKGKHHIGDFLPPEELEKFVETVNAVKEDRTPGTTETYCYVCMYRHTAICTCVGIHSACFKWQTENVSLMYPGQLN